MESALNSKLSVFVFVACYSDDSKKNQSNTAVTKAALYEVAVEMEDLGQQALVFTTEKKLSEIKKVLRFHKTPFLLVEIGPSYDLELINGFFPESSIELLKKISKNEFSKDKPYLNRILESSVIQENFEIAAPMRDITNQLRVR